MSAPERGSGSPSPVKVSVIVSTYCSGEALSRLVRSLDHQTMSQEDFESVFVDDGSPDGTVARLRDFARDRPHMRVTSIPHSGWPSRPRNVGISMARGDYVVFLDHDDELYPGALEHAWAFAVEHSLDAVTAKETKSNNPFFTWGLFLADVAPPAPRDPMMLVPMTPHKLYRRQHLLDHDVRFKEGGRVLWEDNLFNIDVYASGARVGVLASRPFYHWRMDGGVHLTDSYSDAPDDYWRQLLAVFDHIDRSAMSAADADRLRTSRFSYWVLWWMVGPGALKRDDVYYARTLDLAAAFVAERVPDHLDDRLELVERARATLLRGERRDLLRPLAHCDRRVSAEPVATDVRMVDGLLHVSCVARWTDATGAPLALRRDGGRLVRVLPDEIATALPPELLDFSDAVARARGDLSLHGRRTQVGWPAPGQHESDVVDLEGDRVAVETRTTAVFDPRTAAMGRPLELDQWRIAARATFGGFRSHPFVVYRGPTMVGLVEGHIAVARASRHHHLLLEVGTDVRSLLRATTPDAAAATVRRSRSGRRLVVPVPEVSTAGPTRLPVRFRLREASGSTVEGSGHLVGEDGRARVELDFGSAGRLARGRHRLVVDGPGRGWGRRQGWVTEIVVRVGRGGRFARVRLEREPVPRKRRRPAWVARPE